MNPKSTDIFGRLSWLTKSFKNLCCRLGILEQTVAECCEGGGGGGGTNPTSTYIPYNNAGTFDDSYLVNNTTSSVLKSVYGGNDVGIKCDFVNGDVYLGDPFGIIGPSSTSVYMYVNPGAEQISLNAGGNTYFYCEKAIDSCYVGTYGSNFYFTEGSSVRLFNNSIYNGFEIIYNASLSDITDVKIGDYTNTTTGTSIITDVTNSIIKTQYGGNDQGLKLDFANLSYQFGDISVNNDLLEITLGTIVTRMNGTDKGIQLYTDTFKMGDMSGLGTSGVWWGVDITNSYLIAGDALFDSTGSLTYSGNNIPIKINGTTYYLPLYS